MCILLEKAKESTAVQSKHKDAAVTSGKMNCEDVKNRECTQIQRKREKTALQPHVQNTLDTLLQAEIASTSLWLNWIQTGLSIWALATSPTHGQFIGPMDQLWINIHTVDVFKGNSTSYTWTFFFFTNHENTVLTKVVAEISEHINITKKMSDGARHMMMAVHADCLRHYI